MSATTMAVATRTETVDPPAVRSPGHAALPVSDAVISVHTWGARVTPGIFHRASWPFAIQATLTMI
jgi:hypothetical protein